jgi:hypothetical protein
VLGSCHRQQPSALAKSGIYFSMMLAWFCLMLPTKGITIKQPVLLVVHYSLVTTSADAAAVHSHCPSWYVP